jgi:hypothetical protein
MKDLAIRWWITTREMISDFSNQFSDFRLSVFRFETAKKQPNLSEI